MPAYLATPQWLPTTAIAPMSFVCADGVFGATLGGSFSCRQATATTDKPIAISQTGYDIAPGLIAALTNGIASYTQVAAQAAEEFNCFMLGDICPLVLGAGGATSGDLLSPDTSGNGIKVSVGNYYGAMALQTGAAGEIIQVVAVFGKA